MNKKNLDNLITKALAIEAEEAKEAGALGYMARALTQATLPHSKQSTNEFTRRNGAFTLSIMAPSNVGLPYGSIPRLLISWVTTEAVKTKSRYLELGPSLSAFMAELGLQPTGGRWGSITRLRNQTNRLFQSFITCSYTTDQSDSIKNIMIVDEAELWWSPKTPNQATLWQSFILLHDRFFEEVTSNPVPIDMRALRALKRSPMALDIYCWLTYRMSYLKKSVPIPWEALQMQFGAGYPFTPQGKRDFKKKFLKQLKAVSTVYPLARVEPKDNALLLYPSHTHITKN
jgi:hypothetical protein